MGWGTILEGLGIGSIVFLTVGLTAWTIVTVTRITATAKTERIGSTVRIAKQEEEIAEMRQRIQNLESIVLEEEKRKNFEKAL